MAWLKLLMKMAERRAAGVALTNSNVTAIAVAAAMAKENGPILKRLQGELARMAGV